MLKLILPSLALAALCAGCATPGGSGLTPIERATQGSRADMDVDRYSDGDLVVSNFYWDGRRAVDSPALLRDFDARAHRAGCFAGVTPKRALLRVEQRPVPFVMMVYRCD